MKKYSFRLPFTVYRLPSFLRLCAVFIFCAFAVLGCAKTEIKNIHSKGKNIICFGDSLTLGYGADPGEDYPSILARLINAPVINAGVDSETTNEALKRINSDVLDKDPLLVIIEFGGNDFLKKAPLEATINNVNRMIDEIEAKGAMVGIVDISAGFLFKDYHSSFYRIARQKQAIFIPNVLNGIITNPSMKSDFVHPNADGYKVIARRIYRCIMPYLEQNTSLRESQN